MKTLAEMMELVDALTKICVDSASAESAEELTEYIGKSRAGKYALQTALAEVLAERDAAIAERDAFRESTDFYRQRIQTLHDWQSKMRDPERIIVCDILANGRTLEPAGDRYAMKGTS
jgi:hypothetical protein